METVAGEAMRILQDGRVIAVNIGDVLIHGTKYPLTAMVTSIFLKAGFRYRENIVWVKGHSTVRASKRNLGWQAAPYPLRLFMNRLA